MRHILSVGRELAANTTKTESYPIPYDHKIMEIYLWFEPGSERDLKVYIHHGHRGTTDDPNLALYITGAFDYFAGDGNIIHLTDLNIEGESNMKITVKYVNDDAVNPHTVDGYVIIEEVFPSGGES